MSETEKSNFDNLVTEIGCTLQQKNDEILSLNSEIDILKEKLKVAVQNVQESEE